MIHTSSWLNAACLTLLLAACGSGHKPADPAPASENKMFKQELDKAHGVNDTVLQQKDSLDQSLQQQENPGAQ